MTDDVDHYCVDLGDEITVLVKAGEMLTDEEKAVLKKFIQVQRSRQQPPP